MRQVTEWDTPNHEMIISKDCRKSYYEWCKDLCFKFKLNDKVALIKSNDRCEIAVFKED